MLVLEVGLLGTWHDKPLCGVGSLLFRFSELLTLQLGGYPVYLPCLPNNCASDIRGIDVTQQWAESMTLGFTGIERSKGAVNFVNGQQWRNQWRFIAFFPRPRTTSLLGSRNLFECCFPVINGNILPHSHNMVFICLLPSGHRWIMIIYAYAVHTHTVYTIHRYTIPYSFCFADIIILCIHVRSWLIYILSVTSCFLW